MPDGPEVVGWAAALDAAAAGLPAIRAAVRTVNPHPGGVGVHVHPHSGTLDLLYERFAAELRARGLDQFEDWNRDIWYVNVVHFAGPVDVARLVAWGDARRDAEIGEALFDIAELVRYHFSGTGMNIETMHAVALDGTSVSPPRP